MVQKYPDFAPANRRKEVVGRYTKADGDYMAALKLVERVSQLPTQPCRRGALGSRLRSPLRRRVALVQ